MNTTPDSLHASEVGPDLVADASFAPVAGFAVPAAPAVTASTPEPAAPAEPAPVAQLDAAELAELRRRLTAGTPAPVPAPAAPELAAGTPTGASGIPAVPRQAGPDLTLSRVAGLIAAANRGESGAGAELRAALAVSSTTDVVGITPNAYVAELAGLVNMGRPTASAIRNRPLPAAGMNVTYPHWKTLPSVAVQAAQGDIPSSTKAEIELKSAPVITEAGANELTMQAVDRTDPSAVEALLGALAELYGRKVNVSAAGALATAAGTAINVKGLTFSAAVAALLGGLDPAQTPAGGLFVSVSWDYYCTELVDLTDATKPAWWDGTVSMGGPAEAGVTLSSGLAVVVDPALAAKDIILGARNGATLWENPSAPVNVRTVDLGVLSVDVGVYGYHAVTVEYPGAFSLGDNSAAPAATRSGK